jgi:serine protease Do
MKKILSVIIASFMLCGIGFALTTAEIDVKIKPATVTILVLDKNGKILGHGSGFFYFDGVDPEQPAVVVTNFHVISGKSNKNWKTFSYQVITSDGKKLPVAKFNFTDEKHDLAFLVFDGIKAKDVTSVSPEAADTKLVEGQKVVVIGSPADPQLSGTLSEGIISALREKIGLIQFSAPVAFGSSGSCVLDEDGNLIGVVESILDLSKGENINFAIPAKWVQKLYDDYKAAWAEYVKNPDVVKDELKQAPSDDEGENVNSLNQ